MKRKNSLLLISMVMAAAVFAGVPSHSNNSINPKDDFSVIDENIRNFVAPETPAAEAEVAYTPTDQYYSNQSVSMSHLGNIQNVWDFYKGDDIRVAVIDEGFDYDHPDLMDENGDSIFDLDLGRWYFHFTGSDGHYTSGTSSTAALQYLPATLSAVYVDDVKYSYHEIVKPNADLSSPYGHHGTCVAGTIAAYNHDTSHTGTIGIAPHVKIVPIKVDKYIDSIGEGLYYVYSLNNDSDPSNDIDVVNISMVASSTWSTVTTYAYSLKSQGTIVVASAGNKTTSTATYPAANPNVIGVGALEDDMSNVLASYSNFNATSATSSTSSNNTTLVAPGQVYTTDAAVSGATHGYAYIHGTSFASPIVAGAAALWKQKNPSGTYNDFLSDLTGSCVDIGDTGWDYKFGYGRLSIHDFLGVSADEPTSITIDNEEIVDGEITLEVGDELDLEWTVNGQGTYSTDVSFTLDEDDGTLSIDQNGHIEALSEGYEMVNIISTQKPSVCASVYVTVNAPAVQEESLTITRSSFASSGGYAWYDWSQASTDNTSISGKAELYTTTTTSMQFNRNKGNKVAAIYNSVAIPGSITKIEAQSSSDGTAKSWTAYVTSTACSGSGSTLTFGSNKTTVGTVTPSTSALTSFGTSNKGYSYFCIQENDSAATYISQFKITYTPSQPKTLSSISVYTSPTKLTYTAGEYFSPTGLVITRTYSDSSSDQYAYAGHTSEFSFNPDTNVALTTNHNSVTITYGGKSTTQSITVNAPKTLSSISVETAPTKTTYTAGETFNPAGLVIRRTYSDSTSDTYTYSGHTSEFTFNPSTSTALTTSDVSVTITYSNKSTTQAITVNPFVKQVTGITVTGQITEFEVDDDFEFGGTVTATYNDSTSTDVTSQATFTGYDLSNAGNYTVTVSYTYNNNTVTTTYSITVKTSGGPSGDQEFSGTYNDENCDTTWTLSNATDSGEYRLCPASGTTSTALIESIFSDKNITSDVVITIRCGTFGSGTNPSASTFKIYNSSAVTTEVTAIQSGTLPTSSTYKDVIYTVSQTNASSGFVDDLAIKITKPGKQIRLFSITVEFSYNTTGIPSSISLDTTNVKKEFVLNESFTYTGLVVTANYSDAPSEIISSGYTVSTPDMTTVGQKTITVSYGGKSNTYTITVSKGAITEITATVSKTFYVGETITASDITVVDNFGDPVTGFIFTDYKFTFSDAASGGSLTDKVLTVTKENLSDDFTVQVQRKAHVTPESSETKTVTYTDLPTTYETSTTERTAASGVKFIAYNLANYSGKMQFRKSSGYFQTTQEMDLQTVTINDRETNTLTVYGSNTAGSFSKTITGTDDVYDLSGYKYVKIARTADGAAYCSSISITVSKSGGGTEDPENVANYIMYEDTANQCTTKFTTAKGYFEAMTQEGRNTFMTSDDYVISTARERLEAWARHLGKSITQSGGDYVISTSNVNPILETLNVTNGTLFVVITSVIAVSMLGGYFYIRRRKEHI